MKKIFSIVSMALMALAIQAQDVTLSSSEDINNVEFRRYETVTVDGGFTLSQKDLATLKELVTTYDVIMLDLTNAQFPDNAIPEEAFSTGEGVRKLQGVTLPKSVKKIGRHAFFRQAKIYNIIFPAGSQLEVIEDGAFQDVIDFSDESRTFDIELPASLKTLADNAFRSSMAGNVTFAKDAQIERIGKMTFGNCARLDKVVLPASLSSIDYNAFCGTTSEKAGLQTLVIEGTDKPLTIEGRAFYNCIQLTSVTVNRTVVPKLKSEVFAEEAFENAKITVPEAQKAAYQKANGWKRFARLK